MKNLYCVIFRTGGTENFKWNRSSAMDKEAASNLCNDVKRMGYKAMTEKYESSMKIGLPESYEFFSN